MKRKHPALLPVALLLPALLLSACVMQPIQPAPAAAAPAVAPALTDFPTAGVMVAVPEAWEARYEPMLPNLILASAWPPPQLELMHTAHDMWAYLDETPYAAVTFLNRFLPAGGDGESARALSAHFLSRRTSEYQLNCTGITTVVEEPAELTINGQPAAKAVYQGVDPALGREYLAHVWIVRSGDRAVYVACPLVAENEAAFLPLCEQMVASLVVREPGPAQESPRVIAGEIAPGQTVRAHMALPPPGEIVRHYWRFTGAAGRSYKVMLLPRDPFTDVMGGVVDAEFHMVAGEIDRLGDGGPEEFTFTPDQDGDYAIMVRTWFMDPGFYSLRLEEVDDAEPQVQTGAI